MTTRTKLRVEKIRVEKIRQLAREGMNVDKIAQDIGLCTESVRRLVIKNDINVVGLRGMNSFKIIDQVVTQISDMISGIDLVAGYVNKVDVTAEQISIWENSLDESRKRISKFKKLLKEKTNVEHRTTETEDAGWQIQGCSATAMPRLTKTN